MMEKLGASSGRRCRRQSSLNKTMTSVGRGANVDSRQASAKKVKNVIIECRRFAHLLAPRLLSLLAVLAALYASGECSVNKEDIISRTTTAAIRSKRWSGEADPSSSARPQTTSQIPAANPNFEAAFQGECGKNNNSNPCEHVCLDLHDGTYECSCFYGFSLAVDGYSCAPVASSTAAATATSAATSGRLADATATAATDNKAEGGEESADNSTPSSVQSRAAPPAGGSSAEPVQPAERKLEGGGTSELELKLAVGEAPPPPKVRADSGTGTRIGSAGWKAQGAGGGEAPIESAQRRRQMTADDNRKLAGALLARGVAESSSRAGKNTPPEATGRAALDLADSLRYEQDEREQLSKRLPEEVRRRRQQQQPQLGWNARESDNNYNNSNNKSIWSFAAAGSREQQADDQSPSLAEVDGQRPIEPDDARWWPQVMTTAITESGASSPVGADANAKRNNNNKNNNSNKADQETDGSGEDTRRLSYDVDEAEPASGRADEDGVEVNRVAWRLGRSGRNGEEDDNDDNNNYNYSADELLSEDSDISSLMRNNDELARQLVRSIETSSSSLDADNEIACSRADGTTTRTTSVAEASAPGSKQAGYDKETSSEAARAVELDLLAELVRRTIEDYAGRQEAGAPEEERKAARWTPTSTEKSIGANEPSFAVGTSDGGVSDAVDETSSKQPLVSRALNRSRSAESSGRTRRSSWLSQGAITSDNAKDGGRDRFDASATELRLPLQDEQGEEDRLCGGDADKPPVGEVFRSCAEMPAECESGGRCSVETSWVSSKTSDLAQLEPRARCRCPIGRGGYLCQKPIQRTTPGFSGRSYLALPMITKPALTSLRLVFKPQQRLGSYLAASRSSLLLYSQMFALLLEDSRRVELRYLPDRIEQRARDTATSAGGSRVATRVIGSRDVQLDQWNELIVTDVSSDSQSNETENAAGHFKVILVTPEQVPLDKFPERSSSELFVGGTPDVAGQANARTFPMLDKELVGGFVGCIKELSINGRSYDFRSDLSGDSLDGFDIVECCPTGASHDPAR